MLRTTIVFSLSFNGSSTRLTCSDSFRSSWLMSREGSARARPFAEVIYGCIMCPVLSLRSLEKSQSGPWICAMGGSCLYAEAACELAEKLAGLMGRGEDSDEVACFNLCSAL